ncbi:MAG: hypothetical protein BWX71_02719 [Deltaproteobacteria bacterium ADurb.Bin072]|nr:MAG: hypothetical protein BWX71_02719 [Deltaproteobacteria bacterium ADurb.Bin072]
MLGALPSSTVMSAGSPRSSLPPEKPSARAPFSVTRARAVHSSRTVGSMEEILCSLATVEISLMISRLLLLAHPSVPTDTLIPALIILGTGAMPDASFMLLSAL